MDANPFCFHKLTCTSCSACTHATCVPLSSLCARALRHTTLRCLVLEHAPGLKLLLALIVGHAACAESNEAEEEEEEESDDLQSEDQDEQPGASEHDESDDEPADLFASTADAEQLLQVAE